MTEKKAAVWGVGKLGICWALLLAENGWQVTGIDTRGEYVEDLNSGVIDTDEPEVEALLSRAVASETFRAVHVSEYGYNRGHRLHFVVVPTPSLPHGGYDHFSVDRAVSDILHYALAEGGGPTTIVICSTVMPGYCERLKGSLQNHPFGHEVEVVYNPEFIAQGSIISDMRDPDMTLVGCESVPQELFRSAIEDITKRSFFEPSVHMMRFREAEICKIGLNFSLVAKIAVANHIGDVVRAYGGDPDIVLGAISDDTRIGKKYFKYGYGYGGPCLPRDASALGKAAEDSDNPCLLPSLEAAVDLANEEHLEFQVREAVNSLEANSYFSGVTFGPVSYKPGVPMIVQSQQLAFVERLSDRVDLDITIKDTSKVIEMIRPRFEGKPHVSFEPIDAPSLSAPDKTYVSGSLGGSVSFHYQDYPLGVEDAPLTGSLGSIACKCETCKCGRKK